MKLSVLFMKSMILGKKLVMLLLFTLSCGYAKAEGVIIDGLKYYVYPDTHEAVLIDLNTWTGELVIPEEFKYNNETYIVKTITTRAFEYCTELTKVRIPRSLVNITSQMFNMYGPSGWLAPSILNPFIGCTSLQSIEVDESNPSLYSLDGVLFDKYVSKLYSYPAGKTQDSYSIPTTVTWVGYGAFSNNSYLTSLVIPNSVSNVIGGLCNNCTNLKSVKLSEKIPSLGAYTFERCVSLRFLDIPESVSGFGEYEFRGSGIKTLIIRGTFPNGLRDDTFYGLDDDIVIYVQPSEIEKFKQAFSGTVLPLDKYTSIDNNNLKENYSNSTLYDLQGRRINGQPAKGMYIQNGKKFVK